MWYAITAVVALIAGGAAGFFIGVSYLRKQLEKMQSDPAMLQQMAKQMGYNLDKKQMQKMQQMMKNQKFRP
ncbi:YneF family protein [Paenibacillus validus]|uniref:YneF family protein n=1 Tax=Paenibacillus validus TaxID=44253 RepID=A0A7X2ZF69_9BACL|nr:MULTISPECIES: YneF family protein [Paenibacillus]MED4602168.1 YneF family protein [Paenibacillus validus]MED4609325.1 YneF family protein [Paenibacillus validus]MUG73787.1 YneF family protein [Paenibacillus validus]